MGQVIGIVLALVVGWATWGSTGVVAKELDESSAAFCALVFFSPIIGVAVPMALRAIRADAIALAFWVGALAPLLGAANVLFFLFHMVPRATPDAAIGQDWRSALVVAGLWQIPLLIFAIGAVLASARRIRPEGDGQAGQ